MRTISVTNLVQLKASDGIHGRILAWADTSHVYVNLILKNVGKTPGRICLLLPWGAIYGRAKKYKTVKDIGIDIPAKEMFDRVDANKVGGNLTKRSQTAS